MLGRRGPAQASFTPPELGSCELGDDRAVVDPAEIALESRRRGRPTTPIAPAKLDAPAWPERAGRPRARTSPPLPRSPVALLGDGRVERNRGRRNRLEARRTGPSSPCRRGDETIPCGLVAAQPWATAASRSPASRSTSGAARSRTPAAACSAPTAPPSRASTAPAGSSAGRPASSARTRRTRRRRSRASSPTCARSVPRARDVRRRRRAARRPRRRGRRLRRLAADRRRRAQRGEAEARPRVKLCRWDELLAAAREQHLAAA